MIVLDTFESYVLVHAHRAYLIINRTDVAETLVLATHDANLAFDSWARISNTNKENNMNNNFDQAAEGCGLLLLVPTCVLAFVLLQPLVAGILFVFGG